MIRCLCHCHRLLIVVSPAAAALPSPLFRYTLAKEQGYRSRAAFKLIQLNKKYDFLSSARCVLDLGAAPGGWLQVCVKTMPVSSMIIGVDLVPIRHLRGVTTVQADLCSPECRTLLKRELQGWDVDVVLHDGAPNVAGGMVWSKDAYQQNELVLHSLRLATAFMRPQAVFVSKVFRSQDYNSLLWLLQQLFTQVDVTKPLASRSASAEIFVVCRGYRAPKSIDPQLLDPTVVFQQFDAEGKRGAEGGVAVDVFAKQTSKKAERSRQGYAETDTQRGLIGGRSCDVMSFVEAEEPIVALGSYAAFTFDSDTSKLLRAQGMVGEEVQALSADLRVLGKGDFKSLLRWRQKVRDWLKDVKAEAGKKGEGEATALEEPKEEVEEKTEEQLAAEEEQRLTAAIDDLKQRQQHRRRQERRRQSALRQRQQQRLLLNKNNMAEVQEIIAPDGNDELFSLLSVTGGAMDTLEHEAGEEVAAGEEDSGDEDGREEAGKADADLASDSDDEGHYLSQLERNLDSMYEQFKQRRKIVETISSKGEEEIRAVEEGDDDEEEEGEEEEMSDEEAYEAMKAGTKRKREEEKEEGKERSSRRRNPLLVPIEEEEKERAAERTARWFQRDIFSGLQAAETERKEGKREDAAEASENDEAADGKAELRSRKRTLTDLMTPDADSDDSEEEDEDQDDEQQGRWLGEDDESDEDESARRRRQQQQQQGPRRLLGLDSLSKTREQADLDAKKREKREKKNVREERRLQRKAEQEAAEADTLTEDGDDAHMLVDQDSAKKAKRLARRADRLGGGDSASSAAASSASFEEVPAATGAISSDDEAVATTLALASRMLRKRQRTDILDSSYNRYAVDVAEQRQLPSWFRAEERQHMVAQLPVSRSEVDEYKERLKAINARPVKKIAEARMRKKAKMERRWTKIAKKVSDLQQQDGAEVAEGGGGGSMGEKLKRMESLMRKKDKRSKRGDRRYVVTGRGGGGQEVRRKKGSGKPGGLTVSVDKRLKKDKRGRKVAEKQSKKHHSTTNKRKRNM